MVINITKYKRLIKKIRLSCIRWWRKPANLKKSVVIALIGLLLSIGLNIGLQIFSHSRYIRLTTEVEEKQQTLDNVNTQLEELENSLDETKTKNDTYKEQVEKLKKEKDDLNKQLQAKIESQKKAAQAEALATKKQTQTQITYAQSGSCQDLIRKAGVPESEVNAAYTLIMKESGCSVNAVNKSSGACGIPQALPCSKLGSARGNAVAEIQWMQNYVRSRYGGWQQALNFHYSHNWY